MPSPSTPAVIVVVVPARNEQRRLGACLASLYVARGHLTDQIPAPPVVRVVVVLDRCTDDSEPIAESWPHVETIRSSHGKVGAARDLGVRHGLTTVAADTTWIACTDADSAVPPEWLATHLQYAAAGVDLQLGTVRPDPVELTEQQRQAWLAAHDLADGHEHVHGANLGIRGNIYQRAGGFPWAAAHEDVLLAERVRTLGVRVASVAASPVITSARTGGRAPEGMSTYLRYLLPHAPSTAAEQRLSPIRRSISGVSLELGA